MNPLVSTAAFLAVSALCFWVPRAEPARSFAGAAGGLAFVFWLARRDGQGPEDMLGRWPGLGALPLGAAAAALTIAASGLIGHWTPDPLGMLGPGTTPAPAEPWGASAAIALMAVAEEVFFRGYLFSAVLARRGPRWAVAATTVLFTVAHPYPPLWPQLALDGLIAGALRARTGSAAPAVVAHVLHNVGVNYLWYFR